MADRFLSFLKEVNFENYDRLLNEIRKYKNALNLIQDSDESLKSALVKVEEECEKKIQENNQNTRKRKSIDSTQGILKKRAKTENYVCLCGKSYRHRQSLHKHKKKCNLLHHENHNKSFQCRYCSVCFGEYSELVTHLEQQHPLPQTGTGNISSNHKNNSEFNQTEKSSKRQRKIIETSAIDNSVQNVKLLPNSDEKDDLLLFYAKTKIDVERILQQRRQIDRNIKFYLNTRVKMVRTLNTENEDESSTTPHFRCKMITLLENDEIEQNLNSAFQQMSNNMEEFINKGSDWQMEEVINMEVVSVPYVPINGSSYLPLPPDFQGLRSIVNVRNRDSKCFIWSILAALHPAPHHPERLGHYLDFENELDTKGMSFPVSITKIPKFEQNNGISLNVFGMEEGTIFPLYLSKLDHSHLEVDLLYLTQGDISHYCLIKDLNKFLSITKRAKIKHYFCRRCLHGFVRNDILQEHKPYCKLFDFQHVKYPKEGQNDVLEFKSFYKQLRVPFVIYADFETLVENLETDAEYRSSSHHESHFKPCGYAYKVVCSNENYSKPPVVFRGENAVENFLRNIINEETRIKEILSDSEPLKMTTETEKLYSDAIECHICKKPFSEKSVKVRDHFHIGVSGDINSPGYSNFRGAACQDCNLNFKEPKFIPVIFHNLRGFDGHLLCQAIGVYKDKEIKCIPQNMNKYVSTSLGDLRFIDSYQFMSSSLETLIENLAAEGLSNFVHFQKTFKDENIVNLLLRKNVYCYDYFDKFEKFNECELPPKEAFFNRLKKEHISEQDYAHVHEVWATLKMQTLGDLHDNYVLTDVLLLCDVFEKFRDMTMNFYGLDACHYYTAPGLAWDAALKMTNIRLDLLTDPLMYNFFEAGLRGGVSMISKKFSEANNPLVDNYDPDQPNTQIA
ncbi:hypothetical protein FSP39_021352 [Pinctada imbricata]|uniref:C2H2-type domain-containing protein n=1 Tax=Pinctada imbricata TaxID=66713 RepID=A0AA88YGV6_PINIB|nr:hypothetical protein FSP39_021352 [Pinctada imbricata]